MCLHGQVDRGVQTEATLVGAESGVELDAVAAVDLELASIVLPDDAELEDTLGDRGDLESGAVLGELLEEGAVLEGAGKLVVRLLELGLGRKVGHDGGWNGKNDINWRWGRTSRAGFLGVGEKSSLAQQRGSDGLVLVGEDEDEERREG